MGFVHSFAVTLFLFVCFLIIIYVGSFFVVFCLSFKQLNAKTAALHRLRQRHRLRQGKAVSCGPFRLIPQPHLPCIVCCLLFIIGGIRGSEFPGLHIRLNDWQADFESRRGNYF